MSLCYVILKQREASLPFEFHHKIMSSIVAVGAIIMASEFVAQIVYLVQNSDIYNYHYSLSGLIYISLTCLFLLTACIMHNKGLFYVTFHVHSLLYIIFIYHYALPTFLLMLVYPIKVIAIVAYLTTYVYVAIITWAIFLLICKQVMKKIKQTRTCIRVNIGIILFALSLYALTILVLLVVLSLVVYAILLNQSSSITAGPVYTILSLIPTASISLVSWMLKTKIFEFEELQNAQNSEDTSEPRAANNDNDQEEERIPLLTVEENGSSTEPAPRSESSPNLCNRHNYGATNAEDKSSETNC